MTGSKDVFLCHAGEDKDSVVRPLAERLEAANIACWVDEAEIRWGESLSEKINEGLASSRFVIVVLSQSFLEKSWARRELHAALNQEANTGAVRVLPLLVGDQEERRGILEALPLLNDKRYIPWDGSGEAVEAALEAWLGGEANAHGASSAEVGSMTSPAMPKLKRFATDQEKEHFLRSAFDVVRRYFQQGLQELESTVPDCSSDYEEISRYKFVARVYHQGQELTRCKVWRGGIGPEGIAYAEGFQAIEQDNAYNEQLTVQDEGYGLGLEMLMGGMFADEHEKGPMTAEQAAEALWRRFIKRLEA